MGGADGAVVLSRVKAGRRPGAGGGDPPQRLRSRPALLALGSAAIGELVADKLQLVLDTPIELESGAVRVGASVGAALYPMHGEDAQSLIHHADMAMYAGKRRARRSSVKSAAG